MKTQLLSLLALVTMSASIAQADSLAIKEISLDANGSKHSINGKVDLSKVSLDAFLGIQAGDYKAIFYIHVPGDIWYAHPFRPSNMHPDYAEKRYPSFSELSVNANENMASFSIKAINRVGYNAHERNGNCCDRCYASCGKMGSSGNCLDKIEASNAIGVFIVPKSYNQSKFCGRLLPEPGYFDSDWRSDPSSARRDAHCMGEPEFIADLEKSAAAFGYLHLDPSLGQL